MVHAEISRGIVIPEGKAFGWSFDDEAANLYLRKNEVGAGVEISTEFEGKKYTIEFPFQDAASLENAGHCLAFILTQHLADDAVIEQFHRVQACCHAT